MSASDSSVNVLGSGTFPVDCSFGTDATTLASVYRQRMVLGDDVDFSSLARVRTSTPLPGDAGLAVRLALGNPDLTDIKDLLVNLLHATNEQNELLNNKLPTIDLGRSATIAYQPPTQVRNVSSTITTGGTAQLLFSSPNVRGFDIQNLSTTEAIGFSWWSTAPVIGNAGTTVLAAGTQNQGGYYVTPPTMGIFSLLSVYIIGATTGHAFTASYWL